MQECAIIHKNTLENAQYAPIRTNKQEYTRIPLHRLNKLQYARVIKKMQEYAKIRKNTQEQARIS